MSAKFNRRHFIAAGSAAAAMPLLLRRASAQAAWPSRNIRMICSYPAGGQTDLLARAFGEFISRQVGQTVFIENKAGASGSIGAAEVARAEPDGHTILCSISTTYVMNRVMMKNPGYDMDKDLTLVSVIPGAGLLLVASPKSGVKTLDEFVAFARNSGKVNFGTYSAGSAPHMTINELNKQYGLNIEPIHYRGEAPMWTGLLEGTLDVAMGSYTAALTRPAKPSRRGVRGAFEEGRRDPGHQDAARARRDIEVLHHQRLFGLGVAEGCAAADRRSAGPTLRGGQQRFEGEGSSQHFRAGTGARLQGKQCFVSARIAGLDRERAGARLAASLNENGHGRQARAATRRSDLVGRNGAAYCADRPCALFALLLSSCPRTRVSSTPQRCDLSWTTMLRPLIDHLGRSSSTE
jgi:hypothetical protein